MTTAAYRFVADVRNAQGVGVGPAALEIDFTTAIECARFEGVRRGRLEADASNRARVEPIWNQPGQGPGCGGFRVVFPQAGGDAFERAISLRYAAHAATAASERLVKAGLLEPGEKFTYRLNAYPADRAATPETGAALFSGELIPQGYPLRPASLAAFTARAGPRSGPQSGGLPVFIGARLLEEAEALSRAADSVETGGMLIGHLCRDRDSCEVFADVRAQIPARHTVAAHARLTFTPQTWAAASAAIELRGEGEHLIGWWHRHPFFCAGCPPENRALCVYSKPCFSDADRTLHGEVFGRAFNLALLLSDLGEPRHRVDLFGWRDGAIEERDFYVLP